MKKLASKLDHSGCIIDTIACEDGSYGEDDESQDFRRYKNGKLSKFFPQAEELEFMKPLSSAQG